MADTTPTTGTATGGAPTGTDAREAEFVTPAAPAAPAATTVVDGLPPAEEQVADDAAGGVVGDGSVAAAVGAQNLQAPTRRGLREYLPTLSAKLVIGLVLTLAIVLFAIVAPFFTQDPRDSSFPAMLRPGEQGHLLGTTSIGYDVLAQLATGARGSLTIGIVVGLIALLLSVLFGIVAGYIGGWTDETLSLVTNIMLVIPGLPLTIVLASYVQNRSMWLVALVLGITSWAGSAIVLRSQAKSLRNRDYVLAARVAGEKPLRIIAVEILPNLLPLVAAQFLFAIIFAILGEAGLAYLGLGPTNSVTWGTMLNQAQAGAALSRGAWWWFVPPGVLIALLGCGLSLINFAIDEIINPKLRNAPKAVKSVRKARKASAGGAAATNVEVSA